MVFVRYIVPASRPFRRSRRGRQAGQGDRSVIKRRSRPHVRLGLPLAQSSVRRFGGRALSAVAVARPRAGLVRWFRPRVAPGVLGFPVPVVKVLPRKLHELKALTLRGPARLALCVQRRVRREVIHALGWHGVNRSAAKRGRPYKRTADSHWRC